jgi:transposase
MAEKTTPTKEQVLTTPSRKILFECLVKDLNIKQAAKEANLSYRYARKWVAESNIQALVLRETTAKTEDLREKRLRQLNARLDNPDLSDAVFAKLLDLQVKLCGWHVQTVTLENTKRQHELDSAKLEELRRLTDLRYNVLPAQNVTWSDVHQDGEPEQEQ